MATNNTNSSNIFDLLGQQPQQQQHVMITQHAAGAQQQQLQPPATYIMGPAPAHGLAPHQQQQMQHGEAPTTADVRGDITAPPLDLHQQEMQLVGAPVAADVGLAEPQMQRVVDIRGNPLAPHQQLQQQQLQPPVTYIMGPAPALAPHQQQQTQHGEAPTAADTSALASLPPEVQLLLLQMVQQQGQHQQLQPLPLVQNTKATHIGQEIARLEGTSSLQGATAAPSAVVVPQAPAVPVVEENMQPQHPQKPAPVAAAANVMVLGAQQMQPQPGTMLQPMAMMPQPVPTAKYHPAYAPMAVAPGGHASPHLHHQHHASMTLSGMYDSGQHLPQSNQQHQYNQQPQDQQQHQYTQSVPRVIQRYYKDKREKRRTLRAEERARRSQGIPPWSPGTPTVGTVGSSSANHSMSTFDFVNAYAPSGSTPERLGRSQSISSFEPTHGSERSSVGGHSNTPYLPPPAENSGEVLQVPDDALLTVIRRRSQWQQQPQLQNWPSANNHSQQYHTHQPAQAPPFPQWMMDLPIEDEGRKILFKEEIKDEEDFVALGRDDLIEMGFAIGTRIRLLKEITKRQGTF